MKKLFVYFSILFTIPCFGQTDTVMETYSEVNVEPYGKGKYIGLRTVKFNRTITWLRQDGKNEFLSSRIEPGSDTVNFIPLEDKYISINHKKYPAANEGDFYMVYIFVVQAENKKTGVLDSTGKPLTGMVFDDAYLTDMDSLPCIVRQKNLWGFLKSDGSILTPRYNLPLHGWEGKNDKVKSIDHFLDGDIAYMYCERIYVTGKEVYALVMSTKGKPVYIDTNTGEELVPDKKDK